MTLTTFRSVLAGGGGGGGGGGASSKTHIVAPGENLSVIARRHGTTVQELVRLNNIPNPNLIQAGQVLQLP